MWARRVVVILFSFLIGIAADLNQSQACRSNGVFVWPQQQIYDGRPMNFVVNSEFVLHANDNVIPKKRWLPLFLLYLPRLNFIDAVGGEQCRSLSITYSDIFGCLLITAFLDYFDGIAWSWIPGEKDRIGHNAYSWSQADIFHCNGQFDAGTIILIDKRLGDACFSGHPWTLIGDQRLVEGIVSFVQYENTADGRESHYQRVNHQPAGESIYRQRLIEPPGLFLWRFGLFLAPGLICSLAGFVLLSGPHRFPRFGAALYFTGIAAMVGGAVLTVAYL